MPLKQVWRLPAKRNRQKRKSKASAELLGWSATQAALTSACTLKQRTQAATHKGHKANKRKACNSAGLAQKCGKSKKAPWNYKSATNAKVTPICCVVLYLQWAQHSSATSCLCVATHAAQTVVAARLALCALFHFALPLFATEVCAPNSR